MHGNPGGVRGRLYRVSGRWLRLRRRGRRQMNDGVLRGLYDAADRQRRR